MKPDLPIELRLYSREATLADIAQGQQYQRAHDNGKLYLTAVLQFRAKTRVKHPDRVAIEWSDWYGIPLVREGIEDQPMQPSGTAGGAPA